MSSPSPFRRAAAVLALLGLGLTGCTTMTAQTTGTSDGAGVIGIALPSSDDEAWVRAGDVLAAELEDRGYRVDLQYAADDARTQGSQVQNMLTKSADAVIVAPLATDALAAPGDAAETDGATLTVFGRGLPVAGAEFAAVVDPAELGRAQAEALLDAVGSTGGDSDTDAATDSDTGTAAPDDANTAETGPDADAGGRSMPGVIPVRVWIVAGTADDPWEQRRHAAAVEVLAPAVADGRIVVTAGLSWEEAAVSDDRREVAAAAEERVRAEFAPTAEGPEVPPAPTALLALGDDVTRGVVTALTTDPPDDGSETPTPTPSTIPSPTVAAIPPTVVGSGADTITVRALDDGVLAALVFSDTRELATPTADAVEALLEGRAPTADGTEVTGLAGVPAVAAGPRTVRPGDIERALIETGWLTPEELSG